MNRRAKQVTEAKAARDVARARFDARLAQVKADLSARGVGGRISDRIGQEAFEAIDYAVDIAKESKGILAGTFAAIAIWLFRNPIIASLQKQLGKHTSTTEENSDEQQSDA